MTKIICSICKRARAGTENESHETASHTYCAKCQFGVERIMGCPMKDMLNPEYRNDPAIKDAINYIKELIRIEFNEKIKWLGEEKKYPEEAERLYRELYNEVKNEIDNEAKKEIKMR